MCWLAEMRSQPSRLKQWLDDTFEGGKISVPKVGDEYLKNLRGPEL